MHMLYHTKEMVLFVVTSGMVVYTSFLPSLNITSFQAMYGFPLPMVAELVLPDCHDDNTRELLQNRQLAAQMITDNLIKAQSRINYQADKHRKERIMEVGDMVYLKMQPYRQTSLSIHNSMKVLRSFQNLGESLESGIQTITTRRVSAPPYFSYQPAQKAHSSSCCSYQASTPD
jgi:hypothetical protein